MRVALSPRRRISAATPNSSPFRRAFASRFRDGIDDADRVRRDAASAHRAVPRDRFVRDRAGRSRAHPRRRRRRRTHARAAREAARRDRDRDRRRPRESRAREERRRRSRDRLSRRRLRTGRERASPAARASTPCTIRSARIRGSAACVRCAPRGSFVLYGASSGAGAADRSATALGRGLGVLQPARRSGTSRARTANSPNARPRCSKRMRDGALEIRVAAHLSARRRRPSAPRPGSAQHDRKTARCVP